MACHSTRAILTPGDMCTHVCSRPETADVGIPRSHSARCTHVCVCVCVCVVVTGHARVRATTWPAAVRRHVVGGQPGGRVSPPALALTHTPYVRTRKVYLNVNVDACMCVCKIVACVYRNACANWQTCCVGFPIFGRGRATQYRLGLSAVKGASAETDAPFPFVHTTPSSPAADIVCSSMVYTCTAQWMQWCPNMIRSSVWKCAPHTCTLCSCLSLCRVCHVP